MTPRLLPRLALVLALLAPVAPLTAQAPVAEAARAAVPEPPRPKLKKDADPNDWRSYFVVGREALENNPRRAAEAFYWAHRYNPASADALHGRWVAMWLSDRGLLQNYLEGAEFALRSRKALRFDSLLTEALAIDPFVHRQLSRYLYEVQEGEWSTEASTQGFLAYTEGRYDRAVRDLATALRQKHPGWQRLQYYRALSFFAMQQYDSAASELTRLAARRRQVEAKKTSAQYDTPAVYDYGVAKAWLQARQLDSARAALMRALGEDVTLYAAHSALAEVALLQGNKDEAVAERRLAVELRPTSAVLLGDYGATLVRVGRHEEAIEPLRKVIELEPYYSGAYYNLGIALERSGRKAEAIEQYKAFLARAPRALVEQIAYAEDRVRGS